MIKASLTNTSYVDLLVRVYKLILSWPDPTDNEKTAGPGNFAERTGPAEGATDGESARFDCTIDE